MRQRYPGVPVVTYVNTSAAVKAESDICCTSGNALAVVESLGVERVIMLPDEYLAQNIAAQTNVKIIAWKGHCEVHELFNAADVRQIRENHPGVTVLAHPECPPEVVAEADFSGSTAAMSGFVGEAAAAAGRAADGMLDERQRRGASSRCRVHPALQSLPAHEADHAEEHPPCAGDRRSTRSTIDPAIADRARLTCRKDAGDMTADFSALAGCAGDHRRRRRRFDDGAAAGAASRSCCCRKRRSARKPPASGRKAGLRRRWAGMTTLPCIWRTPSPPAPAFATSPSRAGSSTRRRLRSSILHGSVSPSTGGRMAAGGSAWRPRTAASGSSMPPATAPAARSCAR